MEKLTFEQLFRYGLPGGVMLIVLVGGHVPSESLSSVLSLGGAALLSLGALVCGGLLYSLHRATIYPLIYQGLLLIPCLRVHPKIKSHASRFRVLLWPTSEVIERDIIRWKQRSIKESAVSSMSEWATQIHYLYCSGWAVIAGCLAGWLLCWAPRPQLSYVAVGLAVLILASGLYSHARYLYVESKVMQNLMRYPVE